MTEVDLLKYRLDHWRLWVAHQLGQSLDKLDRASDADLREMVEQAQRKRKDRLPKCTVCDPRGTR